jgi:ElaB/YqjD/DUF883 family membrane-anchored ribosome-binding protein
LADTEYHDDKDKVAGEPGFKKPLPGIEGALFADKDRGTLSTATAEAKERLSTVTDQAKEAVSTATGQARETLRKATDRAPEMLGDISQRGADYYRRSSRAVSNADSTTVASMFIAGAIGFGIGWLVYGQKSYSGDYVARRMSDSSDPRF